MLFTNHIFSEICHENDYVRILDIVDWSLLLLLNEFSAPGVIFFFFGKQSQYDMLLQQT